MEQKSNPSIQWLYNKEIAKYLPVRHMTHKYHTFPGYDIYDISPKHPNCFDMWYTQNPISFTEHYLETPDTPRP